MAECLKLNGIPLQIFPFAKFLLHWVLSPFTYKEVIVRPSMNLCWKELDVTESSYLHFFSGGLRIFTQPLQLWLPKFYRSKLVSCGEEDSQKCVPQCYNLASILCSSQTANTGAVTLMFICIINTTLKRPVIQSSGFSVIPRRYVISHSVFSQMLLSPRLTQEFYLGE